MKLSYEFTPRILEHIKSWGDEIYRTNKKGWTEYDAKIYFLIHSEIKKMRHEIYEIRKKLKVSQKTRPQEALQRTKNKKR